MISVTIVSMMLITNAQSCSSAAIHKFAGLEDHMNVAV